MNKILEIWIRKYWIVAAPQNRGNCLFFQLVSATMHTGKLVKSQKLHICHSIVYFNSKAKTVCNQRWFYKKRASNNNNSNNNIIIIIHLFIYLFMCWSVCMEWCYVCVRFMWQLDWDCIWHQLGDSSCYCAAPWNSGPWATAIPDIYCSPEPSHQSKMLLFQTVLKFWLDRLPLARQTYIVVRLCKLVFGDYPNFILTRWLDYSAWGFSWFYSVFLGRNWNSMLKHSWLLRCLCIFIVMVAFLNFI